MAEGKQLDGNYWGSNRPVRPANGGGVAVTGGQRVDPRGCAIVGGDRVVPVPGAAVGRGIRGVEPSPGETR
jgi:hypothetical protein